MGTGSTGFRLTPVNESTVMCLAASSILTSWLSTSILHVEVDTEVLPLEHLSLQLLFHEVLGGEPLPLVHLDIVATVWLHLHLLPVRAPDVVSHIVQILLGLLIRFLES